MNIQQTTLPSGLRVVTAVLPGFISTSVAAFVRAGSRDETNSNGGIAHFLEHMAFKGTTSRSALQIAREVEVQGSQINAYTSEDMTAYYVNGLAEAVPAAVAIIGDVLTKSVFDEQELEVERDVILQEIARSGDDPMSVAFDGFGRIAYPEQAIGRPIIGTREFIQHATAAHFRDFVAAHYTTENIIVVGTGAVEHASFVALVSQHFADLPTGKPFARVPAIYGGGLARETDKPFEQVTAILGFATVGALADKAMAHAVMADVLGDGMSSPLFQEVREKRGLAYAVGSWAELASDHGLLMLQAGTTTENVEELFEVMVTELIKLADHRDDRDLLRAKNSLLTKLATQGESPFGFAEHMAKSLFLRGTIDFPIDRMAKVKAVTMDDVREAARHAISGLPTISLVGPAPALDYVNVVTSRLY